MASGLFNAPAPLIPPPVYEHGNRDPETASILSSAPSYVSDRPPSYVHRTSEDTYRNGPRSGPASSTASTITLVETDNSGGLTPATPAEQDRNLETREDARDESHEEPHGLPALRFAPGFSPHTSSGRVRELENHSYQIRSWNNVHSSHAARQYQNVAARRHSQQAAGGPLGMGSTAPCFSNSSTASTSSLASSSTSSLVSSASSARTTPPPDEPPLNPREDPALVGELAASRAKAQRLYREMCMSGREEGLRHEGRTWDFMLAQMADWEDRGRSWNRFRHEMQHGRGRLGGKILGRKVGGLPGGLMGF